MPFCSPPQYTSIEDDEIANVQRLSPINGQVNCCGISFFWQMSAQDHEPRFYCYRKDTKSTPCYNRECIGALTDKYYEFFDPGHDSTDYEYAPYEHLGPCDVSADV